MKRFYILILSLALAAALIACGSTGDGSGTEGGDTSPFDSVPSTETEEPVPETEPAIEDQLSLSDVNTITVDSSVRHQEIESFGASGAWWAQFVGTNEKTRDRIATLLFDPDEGIGLNAFRYNLGAGSQGASSNSPAIGDIWRRAYSFEKSPGVYNWNRDAGAVWFMKKSVELGADEIVMFVNSPLERLTISGHAYANANARSFSNLDPSNYQAFATYVLDVAEHFYAEEGLPIKFISPINEALWDWTGDPASPYAQEGCHYENSEVIALLKVFVDELEKREKLEGVEISAPEGVSWNNDMLGLSQQIMRDKKLGKYFTALDNHSYWTDANAKKTYKAAMSRAFPELKFRQSEWCEMVNGRDLSMDSAFNLAQEIHDDMTILDCISWHYWIAVSCYDYRDGLIYTDANGNSVQVPKRLWAMGNYSRFIDRGYTRVDCESDVRSVSVSAYEGTNERGDSETIIVVINKGKSDQNFSFAGIDAACNRISVNVTDKSHDLERTYYAEYMDGTAITVPAESVTTIVISARSE